MAWQNRGKNINLDGASQREQTLFSDVGRCIINLQTTRVSYYHSNVTHNRVRIWYPCLLVMFTGSLFSDLFTTKLS